MGEGEGARWSVRLRLVAGGSEVADRDRQRPWPRAAKTLADSSEVKPEIDEPASHDENGRRRLVAGGGTGCLARNSHIHATLSSRGAATDAEASVEAVAEGADWWVTPPRRGRAILSIVHARAARPARSVWPNRNHPEFSSRGATLALERRRAGLLSTGVSGQRGRRKSDDPCGTGLAARTCAWLARHSPVWIGA